MIKEITEKEFEKLEVIKRATHLGIEYITVSNGVVQIHDHRIIFQETNVSDIPKANLHSNNHKILYINWNSDKMIKADWKKTHGGKYKK